MTDATPEVPESGSFRAYKLVRNRMNPNDFWILELLIPETARRTGTKVSPKCRCDKALVVGIVDAARAPTGMRLCSIFFPEFAYVVGETVQAPIYDDSPDAECRPGIHFFMTPEGAMSFVRDVYRH